MSKIPRIFQKIFASGSANTDTSVFGSLKAGTPTFTKDGKDIQKLDAFLQGFRAAIIGDNSPAIQDHNSLYLLLTQQIAYLFQQGIPEYDEDTTYFIGSRVMANDGSGKVFICLKDNVKGVKPAENGEFANDTWVLDELKGIPARNYVLYAPDRIIDAGSYGHYLLKAGIVMSFSEGFDLEGNPINTFYKIESDETYGRSYTSSRYAFYSLQDKLIEVAPQDVKLDMYDRDNSMEDAETYPLYRFNPDIECWEKNMSGSTSVAQYVKYPMIMLRKHTISSTSGQYYYLGGQYIAKPNPSSLQFATRDGMNVNPFYFLKNLGVMDWINSYYTPNSFISTPRTYWGMKTWAGMKLQAYRITADKFVNGNATITFTQPFDNLEQISIVGISNNSAGVVSYNNKTATSVDIQLRNGTGGVISGEVSLIVFGW